MGACAEAEGVAACCGVEDVSSSESSSQPMVSVSAFAAPRTPLASIQAVAFSHLSTWHIFAFYEQKAGAHDIQGGRIVPLSISRLRCSSVSTTNRR